MTIHIVYLNLINPRIQVIGQRGPRNTETSRTVNSRRNKITILEDVTFRALSLKNLYGQIPEVIADAESSSLIWPFDST